MNHTQTIISKHEDWVEKDTVCIHGEWSIGGSGGGAIDAWELRGGVGI